MWRLPILCAAVALAANESATNLEWLEALARVPDDSGDNCAELILALLRRNVDKKYSETPAEVLRKTTGGANCVVSNKVDDSPSNNVAYSASGAGGLSVAYASIVTNRMDWLEAVLAAGGDPNLRPGGNVPRGTDVFGR